MVPFVQFKNCEKQSWRNVTFSEVARLHYSWKYNIRSNVNSDLSIVIIFRSLVESIGVIKKMKEILLTEKDGIPMLLYFHALLKVIILDGCFSRFLNCTNGIKLCNASHKIKLCKVILGKVLQ